MSVNDYNKELIDAADENGWDVLEIESRSPGYITISDRRQTEITIRSYLGLDTKHYIKQLKRPELKAKS